MEVLVTLDVRIAQIEPHYPKTCKNGGRPPYPLPTLLRIHLVQQWPSLREPVKETGSDRSADQAPLCWYGSDPRQDPSHGCTAASGLTFQHQKLFSS